MPWKRIGWPPLVTFVNGQVLKIIIYPSVHTALDIQVSNVTTHAVRKVILQYEWLAIYYLWYLNFFYLSAPFYDKLDNNNSSSSSGDNPNEKNDPKQPWQWLQKAASCTVTSTTPASCHYYYYLWMTAKISTANITSTISITNTSCQINRPGANVIN